MSTDILKMIYFAFFHSTINYGIIAWGGSYKHNIDLLLRIQNRLFKIISKNNFLSEIPLNVSQLFIYESLCFHYNTLKNIYVNSNSITRNKSIQIPKITKNISKKIVMFGL